MNEERLQYIKDRLNKFYKLVEPICQHWSKRTTTFKYINCIIAKYTI